MTELWQTILEAGPFAVLTVLVLIGAAREWWVWGYIYRRERQEKEFWRDKTLTHLGLSESVIGVASELAPPEIQIDLTEETP